MVKSSGPIKKRPRAPTQFKAWRKYRDLTQEQLAERIGMTKTRVSLKETGKEPYDQYYLEAMADALRTDAASLLARDPGAEDSLHQLFDALSPAMRARALEVVRALKIADERPTPEPSPASTKSAKFRKTKQKR
jgi:transcriptional regulator with XRE-family HTH domain